MTHEEEGESTISAPIPCKQSNSTVWPQAQGYLLEQEKESKSTSLRCRARGATYAQQSFPKPTANAQHLQPHYHHHYHHLQHHHHYWHRNHRWSQYQHRHREHPKARLARDLCAFEECEKCAYHASSMTNQLLKGIGDASLLCED